MRRTTKFSVLITLALASLGFLGLVVQGTLLQAPSSGTWAPAPGAMAESRANAAAAALPDGSVLVTGGDGAAGSAVASAELFNLDGSFYAVAPMAFPRAGHVAVALKDGRVLVAGGNGVDGNASNSAEVFDPTSGAWQAAGAMLEPRAGATATRLSDGRVLIAGGANGDAASMTLELFDPTSDSFVPAGVMSTARKDHAAALLAGDPSVPTADRVLVAGGSDGANALASTEIWDAASGAVVAGPALSVARSGLSATTLLDGSVLLAGGAAASGEVATTEVFLPASGLVELASSQLGAPRQKHLAIFLPHNSSVLFVGGTAGSAAVSAAELYMPWAGGFQSTGQPSAARSDAAASAASEGMLVVAGGCSAGVPTGGTACETTLASAEVYGFATIKTDKDDYAPYEIVTITGGGWESGDDVILTLHETNNPVPHADRVWIVTADANGNLFDNSFYPEEHDIGVRFYLTAEGERSQAQATFTDARNWTLTFAGTGSGSVTITPSAGTVSAPSACGGTGSPASSQTVTSSCVTPNNITTSTNGATVTFSASASGVSTFGGWSSVSGTSSSTCSGTTNPCSVVFSGGGGLTVTFNPGPATQLSVETAANGSGTVVPAQSVIAGNTVTGYAISRDFDGHFIANVAATWSLINKTGGVLDGDLVPSVDTKSATFTGHLVGTAQMQATAAFTGSSGTLTVVGGSPAQLAFLQQPTNTQAGSTITPAVTVQLLDAGGNLTNDTGTQIQILIDNNPNTGTLSGSTSGASSNGLVTYSTLSIDNAGAGYTLRAQHGNLTPATSDPFDITSADDIAPTTTKVVGEPKFTPEGGPDDYYVAAGTTFTLSCDDGDGSGCDGTFYQVVAAAASCPVNTAEGLWNAYAGPFSLSGADGEKKICFFSKDEAGNREDAKSQLHFLDTTDPEITKSVPGSPKYTNGDTFVTSATTLRVSVTDEGSGVESCSISVKNSSNLEVLTPACGDGNNNFTLPSFLPDGAYTVSADATDNVGNSSDDPFTVILDNTPPVVTVTVDAADTVAASGWYNIASSGTNGVLVHVSASDGSGAGVKNITCTSSLTGEVFNSSANGSFLLSDGVHSVSCTATDNVDNSGAHTGSTAMPTEFKIDQTAPGITITTPPDGATYLLNEVVNADFECTDATSGVDTCVGTVADGSPIDTASVGSKSFTVNAQDKAANPASLTHNYNVHYGFAGLFDPYAPPPGRAYKVKSAIPLKWDYTNVSGTPVPSPTAAPQVKIFYAGSCTDSTAGTEIDYIVASGNSGYQYDTLTYLWQFNWKTTGWSPGCYVIQIYSAETGQTNPSTTGGFLIKLVR